jgi:cupin fold WbuC family metalloprotein
MNSGIDSLNLFQDPSAKSESYYCGADSIVINDETLVWLKMKLDSTLGNTVRICLHSGADSKFHEMLIAHKRIGAFKPHKHLVKSESYHVVEGLLRVNRYDDQGRLSGFEVLGANGSGFPIIYRIPENVWHSTEPGGDYVIFHESKSGPFVSSDNVYPNWK